MWVGMELSGILRAETACWLALAPRNMSRVTEHRRTPGTIAEHSYFITVYLLGNPAQTKYWRGFLLNGVQ